MKIRDALLHNTVTRDIRDNLHVTNLDRVAALVYTPCLVGFCRSCSGWESRGKLKGCTKHLYAYARMSVCIQMYACTMDVCTRVHL